MSIMKTEKWRSIFNSSVHDYIFNKLEDEARDFYLNPYDFRQEVRYNAITQLARGIKKSIIKENYSRRFLESCALTPPEPDRSQYDEVKMRTRNMLANEVHTKILSIGRECRRLEDKELEEAKNAKTRKSA